LTLKLSTKADISINKMARMARNVPGPFFGFSFSVYKEALIISHKIDLHLKTTNCG